MVVTMALKRSAESGTARARNLWQIGHATSRMLFAGMLLVAATAIVPLFSEEALGEVNGAEKAESGRCNRFP